MITTGLVAALADKDFDIETWLLEDMARYFDVCVTLKEERSGMDPDEIVDFLQDDSSVSHHSTALQDAKDEYSRLRLLDPENVADELEEQKTKATEEFEERTATFESDGQKYRDAGHKLRALNEVAYRHEDVLIRNLVDFALEQVSMVLDKNFLIDDRPEIGRVVDQTPDQYLDEKLEIVRKDIAYHIHELAEAVERRNKRVESYQKLRSFVESNLNPSA